MLASVRELLFVHSTEFPLCPDVSLKKKKIKQYFWLCTKSITQGCDVNTFSSATISCS